MLDTADIAVAGTGAKLPELIPPGMRDATPDTLTIITTYRCNAACADCCFECSPQVPGRLSPAAMRDFIDRAVAAFPGLRLAAFSGGECFLLKQDLFDAIAHAHGNGLRTRCVTNGFWGKTRGRCEETVRRLVSAGIDEINISTGRDHQQWIPVDSVIRAACSLVENGVVTVVTVEQDEPGSECLRQFAERPEIRRLLAGSALFRLQCNSWMPFHETSRRRRKLDDPGELRAGCRQLFRNVTLTPNGELAACCGLTMEHIPEMKLGTLPAALAVRYYSQVEDFLKVWLHVDGPFTIITRLFGDAAQADLDGVVHICQACAILHRHPAIRERLRRRYREFVPDVMNRFYLKYSIDAPPARIIHPFTRLAAGKERAT